MVLLLLHCQSELSLPDFIFASSALRIMILLGRNVELHLPYLMLCYLAQCRSRNVIRGLVEVRIGPIEVRIGPIEVRIGLIKGGIGPIDGGIGPIESGNWL